MLARNPEGKIKAGIIGFSYNEVKGLEDDKTYYIEGVVVDKEYRKNGIGSKLMSKAIETTKGIFTDVLLTGYNKSVPLYSKLGFEIPNTNNPKIQAIVNKIKRYRTDIPKYTQIMTKTLDETQSRWWERMYNKIKIEE